MDNSNKIKVMICIHGGVVQSAKANSPNVEIEILDYDDLKMAEEDPTARDEYERYLEMEKRYYSMEYLIY
jgi:hypothetical protein